MATKRKPATPKAKPVDKPVDNRISIKIPLCLQ